VAIPAQRRDPIGEELREDMGWALCVLAVIIGIATDSLVTATLEGLYRVYWWARLLIEKFLKSCYRSQWWLRHLAHQSIARSQNYACAVLDWLKLRTTHRHLRR
jgi:hypothetical protein